MFAKGEQSQTSKKNKNSTRFKFDLTKNKERKKYDNDQKQQSDEYKEEEKNEACKSRLLLIKHYSKVYILINK